MTKAEAGEDARRKLHASILVVVKADGKPAENNGTPVAMKVSNFARPHFTADGNTQPQRREAFFASLLAMYDVLERLEKFDKRALVFLRQLGAEQMPAIEHEVGRLVAAHEPAEQR